MGELEWEDQLAQVLLTKTAEIVQEACQVLEKHGWPVKKDLKSELYYSLPSCVPSTALCQLDSGTCTNCQSQKGHGKNREEKRCS